MRAASSGRFSASLVTSAARSCCRRCAAICSGEPLIEARPPWDRGSIKVPFRKPPAPPIAAPKPVPITGKAQVPAGSAKRRSRQGVRYPAFRVWLICHNLPHFRCFLPIMYTQQPPYPKKMSPWVVRLVLYRARNGHSVVDKRLRLYGQAHFKELLTSLPLSERGGVCCATCCGAHRGSCCRVGVALSDEVRSPLLPLEPCCWSCLKSPVAGAVGCGDRGVRKPCLIPYWDRDERPFLWPD